jgi:RNA polymerase primary sigma factor
MAKTKEPSKKISVKQAEEQLDSIYEKDGIISGDELQKIMAQTEEDDEGFFEVLDHLHANNEKLDESAPEEKLYEDEIKDGDYKPSVYESNLAASDESGSSLSRYFAEISKFPLLTKEQEIELSKRVLNKKDPDDAKEAEDELVNSNLRLVASIASSYRQTDATLSYQDLISYGNSGLITAAQKFDYKKGCRFSTYASFWIRQAISRSIALYGHTIKVPVYIAGEIQKIKAVQSRLTNKLGQEPTSEEIAKELGGGIDAAKVEEILSYDAPVVSLDKPVGKDEEGSLADLISDDSETVDFSTFSIEDVRTAMQQTLTQREYRLVNFRYGLFDESPHTLEEAGALEGVTRERARQIIEEAKKKMGAFLSKENDGSGDKD